MISHGTLLFIADLGEVANALQVKRSKIISKGHKSIRSCVANITEFINEPLSIEDFRALLWSGLYEEMEPFGTYHLTSEEWKAVEALKEEKCDSWAGIMDSLQSSIFNIANDFLLEKLM